MARLFNAAWLTSAVLALAACDGTSSRLGAGEAPAGGDNGGDMQPATQLRTLVIDNVNNNTNATASPVDINSLELEIDTTPVNLDLVTG